MFYGYVFQKLGFIVQFSVTALNTAIPQGHSCCSVNIIIFSFLLVLTMPITEFQAQ